ncbi:MAG: inositol monophosphatase [Verrucomicrobiae bacterium]
MTPATHDDLRRLLCELGHEIRDSVLAGRTGKEAASLSMVADYAGGDTIYAADKFSEEAILAWFGKKWPAGWPVQVVMEGIERDLCFPAGTPVSETQWKCILDPIDGTRGIMYDKRSAWALGGIAPQRGEETPLSEIVAAAMTEIPTSKQWRADQLSTTLTGPLVAASFDVREKTSSPLAVVPSSATDFAHGFSSLVKFFPEGRTLTAQIEERIWDELIGLNSSPSPTIFDDQYISTGGQFYEVACGHDRMVGDLRPMIFRVLDLESSLVCHPYDVCAALILQKTGAVYEHPLGGFPDAPLDTMSGVAWIAYANEQLASLARPVVRKVLGQFLK